MRPTVIFVHGVFIWDPEWWWHLVAEQLSEHGIASRSVQLPSTGPEPPLGDLFDDAAAVRQAIDEVQGPVILVGHSYGGMVITQAAAKHPKVAHLVYIAAFVPEGTSALMAKFAYPHVIEAYEHELGRRGRFAKAASKLLAIRKGFLSSLTLDWMVHDDLRGKLTTTIVKLIARDGYVTSTEGGSKTVMLNELPDRELIGEALSRLVRQSLSSGLQVPDLYAWREIPSTFVVCLNDMDVPIEAQHAHARRCDHLVEIPSNHFAHLERPEMVCDALLKVAEIVDGQRRSVNGIGVPSV